MRFTGNAASDPNSVIPADEYFLCCTHVQDKDKEGNPLKSKKGNDMWVLEMTVHEGPQKDRKLWHYMVFLAAGAPGHGMTLKSIKAFGIDPEGDIDLLPEHLLNVVVKAKVKVDPGTDEYPEPKNAIAKWFTPGELAKPTAVGGEPNPGESTEADPNGTAQEPDEFDPAKMEKQAAAAKPAPAAPAAPAKKPLWGKK